MEKYDPITSIVGSKDAEAEDLAENCNNAKASAVSPVVEFGPIIASSTNQLISILAENIGGEGTTRKAICIKQKPPRRREAAATTVANMLQIHLQRGGICTDGTGIVASKYAGIGSSAGKQKIPRPANAFMLFANEWRKKLAIQNPRESNKDISVRLGVLWKNMAKGIKEKYFALAREVDAEHKRKYPDYVYNPKEARLRKAMREQSRELSRQSILQTAIASASGAGAGNVSSSGVVTSSNFLNHPMSCSSSATAATAVAVSSLPNNNPSVNSGRIINPWFPVGPTSSSAHLKPIISPRIMAAHQRTMEKTKEAMRKQVECAAAGVFSSGPATPSGNGYGGDFAAHNAAAASANDYCIIAEFGDGQKWHPYQNGGNPYHGRGAGMSKVGLHPNPNVHGPWTQFCGLPLQTSPAAAAAQNPAIRPPRQMVFLQEQQGQHCAFSDEMQMAYVQNKIEVNPRLHPAYPGQGEPQGKSSVSPPQMQQLQDEVKCNDQVSQGWDSGPISGGPGGSSLLQEQVPQDQEDEVQSEVQGQDDSRQKLSCKQPLPGFHQAFGSTEIGRFSRSEFFANMVGESSNTIPEAYLPAPVFPFSPTTQSVLGNPISSVADEDLLQMIPEDCYWLGASPSQFSHNQSFENATNYAAFLDYSHRLTMNQEWFHPGATAQELQAAFIEQPSLFHESNNLFGHEHLAYGSYSCPGYNNDQLQNRQTPNNGISEGNLNELIEANEQMSNSKQPVMVKQNDRICVMLEANQAQLEKDIM